MNGLKHTNDGNQFSRRKRNPASLTQDEIADIMRWADTHDLSEAGKFKLLLFFRERKKAAYATKKKKWTALLTSSGQEKVVALTYDDGLNPPYTNQLLDLLARHHVKATFFVIGKMI